MRLITSGPTLADLRRSLGTRRVISFGGEHNRPDAYNVYVDMMLAVGCTDLPIHLPINMLEQDAAWYVAGDTEEDSLTTFIAIVCFNQRGKCLGGVILLSAQDNTYFSVSHEMNRLFARASRDYYTSQLGNN